MPSRPAWVVVLLGLCALASLAAADGSDVETVARAVATAHAANASDQVAALARRDDPDPWLVADALLEAGKPEVAEAFARAAPRADTAGLPGWLSRETAANRGTARRDALREVLAASEKGSNEDALRLLSALDTDVSDLVSVRALCARGETLRRGRKYGDADAAFRSAARLATDLGWLAQAATAFFQSLLTRHEAGDLRGTLEAASDRLQVEERLGSPQGRGRGRYNVGYTLIALGRLDEGRRHLEEARPLLEQAGDGEYLAKALWSLAYLSATRGDLRGALDQGAESLRLLDLEPTSAPAARFRTDPARTSRFRVQVVLARAAWLAQLGEEAPARTELAAGVEAARATGDLSLQGQAVVMLGVWHERAQQSAQAMARYEEAAVLFQQAGDRIAGADTLRRLGALAASLGAQAEALRHLERAVTLLRAAEARPELARAILQSGMAATGLGRFRDARALLEEALALARAMHDPQLEVDALGLLGEMSLARAEYAEAITRLEEALRKRRGMSQPGGLGALTLALGRVHEALRDDERALDSYARARTELDAEGDARRSAICRQGAAFVLSRLGRHAEARAEFDALIALERTSKSAPGLATALLGAGDLRSLAGDAAGAWGHHQEALDLYAAQGDLRHVVLARTRVGRDLVLVGRAAEGMSSLRQAQEEAESLGAADTLAWCRFVTADVFLRCGDAPSALTWARRGAEGVAHLGWDLEEGEGARARSSLAGVFDVGAVAALRLGDAAALHEFLDADRAATLLSALGGRRALREVAIPADLRRAEDEARTAEMMALEAYREATRAGSVAEIRKSRAALGRAQSSVQEVLTRVQRTARMQSQLALPSTAALKEVQTSLARDEALVVYGVARGEVFALVVTRKETHARRLGSEADITVSLGDLQKPESPFVNPEGAAPLARLLVDSLGLPQGVRTLFVSPEGLLSTVPFRLLVGDRDVVHVPSATAWVLLRKEDRRHGTDVLALGDPDYSRTAPRGAGGRRLSALPATKDEANAVADSGGDVVLLGSEASETRLAAALGGREGWRAVHFACHGLVDPDHPARSSLALAADDANDGHLTTQEMFRLRMPADLVVLSGCETGKGQVVEGEGILGFTRAIMFAGAPRVVVSLWKVDDEATRMLMDRFYARWRPKDKTPGTTAAEALRRAQADVAATPKWKHPYYWAAWELWGLP